MKILYVPTRDPDGIGDMIYSGLKKVPSVKIDEYPYKTWLHDREGELVEKARPFWLVQSWDTNNVIRRLEDIDADSYDHIIVNSPWFDPEQNYPALIEKVKDRMVFIDGHDDPFVRRAYKDSSIYFKRESLRGTVLLKWKLDKRNVKKYYFLSKYSKQHGRYNGPFLLSRKNISPINFSVVPHAFVKEKEKDIDVSLLAAPYTDFRKRFFDKFESIAKKHDLRFVSAPGNLSPKEYIKTIQRSKIVMSLPGSSYDIFRYWEVPYYSVCLMSLKVPLPIPNNFEDGVSAIFFDGLSDFENKLMSGLKSDNYEAISKAGNELYNRHHTDVKRAEQLLEVLRNEGA